MVIFSRNMEILRKSQKKILPLKTTVTKMNASFHELISILHKKHIIQLYVVYKKKPILNVKTHIE